jgi:hypothetical protein
MKTKNTKLNSVKTYAIAGALALGGLLGGGCRTTYAPDTVSDRQHYEVYEGDRLDGYSRKSNTLRESSVKSLDSVAESSSVPEKKYDALGDKYSSIALKVERNNQLMKNANAGADALVVELYDTLNKKKGKLSGTLSKEQKEKFSRASRDLDNLAYGLSGSAAISYDELIELEDKAKTSGNKELISKIGELKNNARNLRIRLAISNALNVTEGRTNPKTLELEDIAERYSGQGLSEIAPEALEKAGMRDSVDKSIDKMVAEWKSGEPIAYDDMVRNYRFKELNPSWRMEKQGSLSGKEQDAIVWYLDHKVAEKTANMTQDGWLKKTGKRMLWFVVPLGPGYKAINDASYLGAKDTLEESVSGDKKFPATDNRDLFGRTLREAVLVRKGATNSNNIPGSKNAIIGDCVMYTVEQFGQTFTVIGIASGGGGGGGSSGGGSKPAPLPDPVDG